MAHPSLAGRALQAVALFVGFYVFALVAIAVLVAIPLAEVVYAHRIHFQLAAFCLGGAWAIGWGVLPRIDRFTPPGPQLDPARQPRLFEKLRGIARETDQPMPEEVFLVFDLNAWVAQRGGVMGFGSRPIMGLGLPLLQVLSVSELQAVIAHEFGHFSGADTKLGPWVYKTRAAIGRTIASLGTSWLRKPFEWYGLVFLSLTQAVSRQQELSADALAARVAGPSALRSGLRRIHGAAPAFQYYLRDDLGPLLGGGFRPPIAEGFARFTRAPRIAEAMSRQSEKEAASGQADRFDTHPSLHEREAALAGLPEASALAQDPAEAVSLLDGLPELELALLHAVTQPGIAAKLRPLDWDAAVSEHWLPYWRRVALERAAGLAGLRVRDLAELFRNEAELQRRFPEHAPQILVSALIAALADAGFAVHADLGDEVALRRGDLEVKPFAVLPKLAAAEPSPERDAWIALVEASGIGELELARS